jgi:hypothetical protein
MNYSKRSGGSTFTLWVSNTSKERTHSISVRGSSDQAKTKGGKRCKLEFSWSVKQKLLNLTMKEDLDGL